MKAAVLTLLLEVMDKEPTLLHIWTWHLLAGLIGLALSLWRKWGVLIGLSITSASSYMWLNELHDPNVGPDILREAGESYFNQSYAAVAMLVVLPCIGAIIKYRPARQAV